MSGLLAKLGWTRDDAKWLWVKVVAIAGLIVSGAVDLSAFGLTEKQQHGVMVVCGAIAAVAGKLSTSPLPGANRTQS